MIWTLVGTLMVGVGAACVVFVACRALRRPVPGWLLPAAAGAGMLSFHIWSDYSWADRTAAELPEHVVVAERYTSRNMLQPWTYLVPKVDRFAVVDTSEIRHRPEVEDTALAVVHLVTRWYPTVSTQQLYDCATPRRADVGRSLEVDGNGRPIDVDWVRLESDDPVRRVVCAAEPRRPNGPARRNEEESMNRERPQWQTRAFSSSTTSRVSASI